MDTANITTPADGSKRPARRVHEQQQIDQHAEPDMELHARVHGPGRGLAPLAGHHADQDQRLYGDEHTRGLPGLLQRKPEPEQKR